jgi:hypothetical protein
MEEVTNDVIALTLTESEVQILWKWLKNEYLPHDTGVIKLMNKVAVAAYRVKGEK